MKLRISLCVFSFIFYTFFKWLAVYQKAYQKIRKKGSKKSDLYIYMYVYVCVCVCMKHHDTYISSYLLLHSVNFST